MMINIDLVRRIALLVAANTVVTTTAVFMIFNHMLTHMQKLETQLTELRQIGEQRSEQVSEHANT